MSPKTKSYQNSKKHTQTLGELIKENHTHQLPIENTRKDLPIENEHIHPGVIYHTSFENTFSLIEKQKGSCKIEERSIADRVWNGFPDSKFVGNKLKTNEVVYNIGDNLQKCLYQYT